MTTRQLHDAIARRFPHRAGRKIQTVSTLLAELMAQGWVTGEKRGGTRWVYRPAVSRDEGLSQLARWAVEEFVREPEDRLCLIREGLRMVGYVPVGSPEAVVDHLTRRRKMLCPSRFRMPRSIDTQPLGGLLKAASCPRGPARDPAPPA